MVFFVFYLVVVILLKLLIRFDEAFWLYFFTLNLY